MLWPVLCACSQRAGRGRALGRGQGTRGGQGADHQAGQGMTRQDGVTRATGICTVRGGRVRSGGEGLAGWARVVPSIVPQSQPRALPLNCITGRAHGRTARDRQGGGHRHQVRQARAAGGRTAGRQCARPCRRYRRHGRLERPRPGAGAAAVAAATGPLHACVQGGAHLCIGPP